MVTKTRCWETVHGDLGMKLVYLGIVKSYNPKPQQDLTTHYIASISSLKAETTRFFQVFEQLRSDYRQKLVLLLIPLKSVHQLMSFSVIQHRKI
jgi:hypothetical protein